MLNRCPSWMPPAFLWIFLVGCSTRAPDKAPSDHDLVATSWTPRVVLDIAEANNFIVSVINDTDTHLVFSPQPASLVVYHEAPDGTRRAITWDASNADMPLLSPFQLVYLAPQSRYTIRKSPYVDQRHGVDWTRITKQKGLIVAVVKPLRSGQLDSSFLKEAAKWPLLDRELRSRGIPVE